MRNIVRPHAFVVMPFGTKEGIDFNAVYTQLLAPALDAAGFEPFRADEELRAGDIRRDMFQELLLADLVIADLSIANPNAWYELGVRHALRSRGIIHVQAGQNPIPFDVIVDRTISYSLKDGAPDPERLERDGAAIAAAAEETFRAWSGRKPSPVYALVPGLVEPSWESLRVAGESEFWDRHRDWEIRLEVARAAGRAGDVLLLAEEAPTWVTRLEARRAAASALRRLGSYEFALEQVRKALEIEPTDLASRQLEVGVLERMGETNRARELANALVEEHPDDAETAALRARIDKEAWSAAWERDGTDIESRRTAALTFSEMLMDAARAYAAAFQLDPRHHYSGINAASLAVIYEDLTGEAPDIKGLAALPGGVEWAATAEAQTSSRKYWARATLAELALHRGDATAVRRAFGHALGAEDRDWFKLDSTRQQLQLFLDLGVRAEQAAAAADLLDRTLELIQGPLRPRQVFLFSGHMVDAPGRETPRFPPERVPAVAAEIASRLEVAGAGPDDLAITSAAAGGDLLFLEACLARGVPAVVHLPFAEPLFMQSSVADEWQQRYLAAIRNPLVVVRVLTKEIGPHPEGVNPFERVNVWEMFSALAYGPERVRFITVWDGNPGDGPGGTSDMVAEVRQRFGHVEIIRPV